MALEFNDPEEKARSVSYELRCKVHVKEVTYQDHQSKGLGEMVSEEMIFLEPYESTQRDLFFTAWLPDYEQDSVTGEIKPGRTEVACKAGHPIYGYFKCAVLRTSQRFNKGPHLFVMTKAAEEELKMLKGGDLLLTVLSQHDEDLGDLQKDFTLAGKKDIEIGLGNV